MNTDFFNQFKNRSFIAILAILFTIFVVATPSVFAQASEDPSDYQSRHYMELVNSVFNFIEQNNVEEVDPKVLYAGALKGMLEALNDPYSTYLDDTQMRSLNDTTVGSFGGVGLSITKPVESTLEKPAYVEVVTPIEEGPGFKAGIQSGDLIVAIEGTSTVEITMDEVLAKLRGTIGESVEVTIRRGKNMEFSVKLVRALIEVPTVKYGMIKEHVNNIGYLKIIEFTPLTAEKVQQAIDSFSKDGYTGLIIDLRNNPGGLLRSVADVADKFIDSGTIVSTKSRLIQENSAYRASSGKTTVKKGLPIIVLINKGSASASEILAGALKDDHLAYLVGERTYGKGSVQQVIPLYDDDGIKLTMARYYTPSDVNIDKIGIPPDLEIKEEDFTEEEEKAYVALFESLEIEAYVEKHSNMKENEIASYAKKLSSKYKLDERLLRRLIRNEVYRTKTPLLYDLDYDIQLNKAIEILNKGNFSVLMKTTKTLKELQDEVKAEQEEAEKK